MLFSAELTRLKYEFEKTDLNRISKVFPQCERNALRLGEIQQHKYFDIRIAATALMHRSALVFWPVDKTGVQSNERLEFLGDAFLNFFVATEAMAAHPDLQEGSLSRMRAAIVGTENLAQKAQDCGFGELLLLGRGEQIAQGQKRCNALADVFESVTAALLLDAGVEGARAWLCNIFAADLLIAKETLVQFDVKTRFQQWTQGILGQAPVYRVVGTVATPGESQFIVGGFIGDIELARASAFNKRDASKLVAAKMQSLVDSGELTEAKLKAYAKGIVNES